MGFHLFFDLEEVNTIMSVYLIYFPLMEKNEFEDLGIEIWIRLFQKNERSLHEHMEENNNITNREFSD